MMDITKDRKIIAAATAGPWEWDNRTIDSKVEPWGEVVGLITKGQAWNSWEELHLTNADAIFIVEARDRWPAALDEIETRQKMELALAEELSHAIAERDGQVRDLQAENARLREALDTYAQYSTRGEVALVSGALARSALNAAGKGEA